MIRSLLPVVLSVVVAHPAVAETLTFDCSLSIAGKPTPLNLIYDGAEAGKLSVKAAYGAFVLDATRETGTDAAGVLQSHIQGYGLATIAMPDKVAFDKCLVAKNPPPIDKDVALLSTFDCQRETPDAPQPVEAKVKAEIITEGENAWIFVTRAYQEKSAVLDEIVEFETTSPLGCVSRDLN